MKLNPALLEEMRGRLARFADAPRIADLEIYPGANPYSSQPAIVCTIQYANGKDSPEQMAGAAVRLAATYLSEFTYMDFEYGSAAVDAATARLWIEYQTAGAALQAIEAALIEAAEAASQPPSSRKQRLTALKTLCKAERTSPSIALLMYAARQKDIPYLPLNNSRRMWQFGWGARLLLFQDATSNEDGAVARQFARDKPATKRFLRSLGLPTPAWRVLDPGQDPRVAADAVGWPCVVKPVNQGSGKGVFANIATVEKLHGAVAAARAFSAQVIVEKFEEGEDHRLTVAHGRLISAVRREHPSVVGDGKSDVRALIEALNAPRQSRATAKFLKPVAMDKVALETLAGQGLTLDSVIEAGRRVRVRANANHATGGLVVDVMDVIHPQVKEMAEQLAAAFGYNTAGIDYITPDIGRSHTEAGGAFLEVNARPSMPVVAAGGVDPLWLASQILGEHPGRIPVTLLLVPEAARGRLFARLEEQAPKGPATGLADRSSGRVGGLTLSQNGLGPMEMVRAPLRYPSVQAHHIVWTVEDMERYGFPVDRVETAVLLDASSPKEWLSTLERISGVVAHASDEEDAVRQTLAQPPAGSPSRSQKKASK